MPGRLLTVGLVCFLLAAGVAMFSGSWFKPASGGDLPVCPYPERHSFAALPPGMVTAVGAYEAIRETLTRGSLEGVAAQAAVIVRAFSADEPGIAAVAKRLAAESDVESARRAFLRLHRLMDRHARRLPGS
jgi:hypothetical protein